MKSQAQQERRHEGIEAMAVELFSAQGATIAWEDAEQEVKDRHRREAEVALEALEESVPAYLTEELRPRTPREALLMILTEVPDPIIGDRMVARASVAFIKEVAEAGLVGSADFEEYDRLAGMAARALKLLGEVREGTDVATLSGEIDEALVIPTDLEMVIERHQRHMK